MMPRYRFALLPLLLLLTLPTLYAQRGETIEVDAITFEDEPTKFAWGHIREYDETVVLPESGRYERILIEYTLKCDQRTSADRFGCGEWDYSTYLRLFPDRFDSTYFIELGRFITPYGIGLSLGEDGFTWVFDVTDYAPLLHDSVRITAGNNQELLHLRFKFVEGIPARDPMSVTRLWSPGNKNYQKVADDEILSAMNVTTDPNAAAFRVNVRPQGGNFNGPDGTDNCSEFCNRKHSVMVNGTVVDEWNVWNECGDNPVYPQGGTWLTDRAGWCPGDIVTTRRVEITDWVTPGEEISLDYDIEVPEGTTPYGHWVFAADMIMYGPNNFDRDAEVLAILAPTVDDRYSRHNPSCSEPKIRIENRGADPITSINVRYGYGEDRTMTAELTGLNIPFMGVEDVVLPSIPFDVPSEGGSFTVEIVEVNSAADEYGPNNTLSSTVDPTDRLPNVFDIVLRTNRLAGLSTSNYELVVTDAAGANVVSRNDFPGEAETVVPLDLPDGCYRISLRNPIGFGLDYWPLRDQLDSGSFFLRSSDGSPFEWFESDFGNELSYSFQVPAPALGQSADTVSFGPVPVGQTRTQTLELFPASSAPITIDRVTLFGAGPFKVIATRPEIVPGMTLAEGELLEVDIEFEPKAERDFTIRLLVSSNDYRGTRTLQVTGTGAEPSSVFRADDRDVAGVSVREVGDRIEVVSSGDLGQVTFRLVGIDGRVHSAVESHATKSGLVGSFDITGVPSGPYIVELVSAREKRAIPITVTR